MKDLKLVVGIPSGDIWHAQFGMCLAMMMADFSHEFPGYSSQAVRVQNTRGSILPQLRNRLMRDAKERGATHLLWIDSDQSFPPDTARRLLAHNLPVVACNIATKKLPSNPTARVKSNELGGERVYSHNQTGLQRVWRIGTGVMLIRLSCLEGIPQPWFNIEWNEEIQDHVGEDWYLCDKLEKHGVAVRIDHDLSREIGHIGEMIYDHDLVEMACLQRETQNPDFIPDKIGGL